MGITKLILVVVLIVVNLHYIYGHGKMTDPINRSSAWRKGFSVPVNYNDNENFCGGSTVQNINNNGRCGVCGDNYASPRPRPNENTGVYGTGTIVKSYWSGSTIEVEINLSTNHWGTFIFSLCPLKSRRELETEECFNRYPLRLRDGSNYYTLKNKNSGIFKIPVVLPRGLTCHHCVLRWHYRTANSWGKCNNGREAVGCGAQENFRSCADIAIL